MVFFPAPLKSGVVCPGQSSPLNTHFALPPPPPSNSHMLKGV